MNKVVVGSLSFAMIVALSAVSQTGSAAPAKSGASGNIARGKYIVNNIAMCGDCHTPMDKTGKPVKGQLLEGAALIFQPTVPVPGWMAVAPGIAGLPGLTEEQAITFFTTGKKPDGAEAAPPMPRVRLNKSDAAAVAAYLKSLGSESKGK